MASSMDAAHWIGAAKFDFAVLNAISAWHIAILLWILSPLSCSIVGNTTRSSSSPTNLQELLRFKPNKTGSKEAKGSLFPKSLPSSSRRKPSPTSSAQNNLRKNDPILPSPENIINGTELYPYPPENWFAHTGSGDGPEPFMLGADPFSLNPQVFIDDEDFLSDGLMLPSGSGAGPMDYELFAPHLGAKESKEKANVDLAESTNHNVVHAGSFSVIKDREPAAKALDETLPSKTERRHSKDHKVEHTVPQAPASRSNRFLSGRLLLISTIWTVWMVWISSSC